MWWVSFFVYIPVVAASDDNFSEFVLGDDPILIINSKQKTFMKNPGICRGEEWGRDLWHNSISAKVSTILLFLRPEGQRTITEIEPCLIQ